MEISFAVPSEPDSSVGLWHGLDAIAKSKQANASGDAMPLPQPGNVDTLKPILSAEHGNSLNEDYIRVTVREPDDGDEQAPWVFFVLRATDNPENGLEIRVPSPTQAYDTVVADAEQNARAMGYLRGQIAPQQQTQ
jgi:hypothetical protein